MDRFEKDLSDLNRTFELGGITTEQYAYRLKTIQARYKSATVEQSRFQKGFAKLNKSWGQVAAVAGSLYMVERGLSAIADEMERMDKIGKRSDALGVSAKFLSEMDFVAQRVSGLDAGGFGKGIEKMTRRLAEAVNGTGEAKVALDLLGLSIKDIEGLNPEQQFKVLARAMDGVKDSGQRMTIATKLFDDEQAKLHTTMALTNDQLKEQTELAKKLGVTFDEAGKKQAAAFQDAKQEFDAAYKSFQKAAIMNAAPELTKVMKAATPIMSGDSHAGEKKTFFGEAALFLSGITQLRALGILPARKQEIKERDLSPKDVPNLEREKLEAEKLARKNRFADNKKQAGTFAEFFAKEKKRAAKEMATANRLGKVGELMNKFSGQGIGEMIGKGLVASLDVLPEEFGKPEKQDQFEAIVTDPLDSIAASSSEAFKIQNKNTSFQKVTEEADKETAKNTKQTADGVGTLVGLLENATGIGL
ncbi:MAG: hypothetical protein GY818_01345 [Planctomycetaceae bacterium]|nr:hypothetical protein [Planctomycetaceae bacterium]